MRCRLVIGRVLTWALVLSSACRARTEEAPPRPAAFSLEGTLSLSGDVSTLGPDVGRVSVFFYRRNVAGFCLRGADSLVALARDVAGAHTAAELQVGIPYALEIVADDATTYPFDVYPVAVWQQTSVVDNACDFDGVTTRRNARGAASAASISACCGAIPAALSVAEAGVALRLDFSLSVDTRMSVCPESNARFARCALDDEAGACRSELGADAAALLTDSAGAPCP
jgi:hypothetical protein